MAYDEPDLPVAGNPISTSGFGFKVRDSIIWLKSQIDTAFSLVKRQGGNATNWNTPGTDNYTISGAKIQTGVVVTETISGTGGTAAVTVTFPEAFTETPLVFRNLQTVDGWNGAFNNIEVTNITTTQCTIQVGFYGTQTGTFHNNVLWLAVGK